MIALLLMSWKVGVWLFVLAITAYIVVDATCGSDGIDPKDEVGRETN